MFPKVIFQKLEFRKRHVSVSMSIPENNKGRRKQYYEQEREVAVSAGAHLCVHPEATKKEKRKTPVCDPLPKQRTVRSFSSCTDLRPTTNKDTRSTCPAGARQQQGCNTRKYQETGGSTLPQPGTLALP